LVNLLLGSHEFAHSDLDLANCVTVVAAIAVDHNEFEILHLFEEVCQCECSLEVRIQIVLDLFSLSDFDPLIVLLFVKDALGVRLAKRVQVSELASRDKEIYLHLQMRSANHCSFSFYLISIFNFYFWPV